MLLASRGGIDQRCTSMLSPARRADDTGIRGYRPGFRALPRLANHLETGKGWRPLLRTLRPIQSSPGIETDCSDSFLRIDQIVNSKEVMGQVIAGGAK